MAGYVQGERHLLTGWEMNSPSQSCVRAHTCTQEEQQLQQRLAACTQQQQPEQRQLIEALLTQVRAQLHRLRRLRGKREASLMLAGRPLSPPPQPSATDAIHVI